MSEPSYLSYNRNLVLCSSSSLASCYTLIRLPCSILLLNSSIQISLDFNFSIERWDSRTSIKYLTFQILKFSSCWVFDFSPNFLAFHHPTHFLHLGIFWKWAKIKLTNLCKEPGWDPAPLLLMKLKMAWFVPFLIAIFWHFFKNFKCN